MVLSRQIETPEREKAAFLRQVHARRVEQIRGNRDLTEAARARQLTETYRTTKARMDDLRKTEQQRLAKRQAELERHVFSAGSHTVWMDRGAEAIAARDAADRADRLSKPAEALEVLRRATATGDNQLAGAVGRRAFELARQSMGGSGAAWGEVVDAYLADHRPPDDPVTAELEEVLQASGAGAGFDFSLMRPQEVPAWGDPPAADAGNAEAS